jgi:hypothetical protein
MKLVGEEQKEKQQKYSVQYYRFVERIRKITKNLPSKIAYVTLSD